MTAATRLPDAGQRPFTRTTLAVYDALVLGLTCRWVWRCPTERILTLYARHLSSNHLEVGVGTGFFLEHAAFPVERPRLALLDLNTNCLERTAARVRHYRPAIHVANVLEPVRLDARFDSIALNYVLHCLPGRLTEKARAFEHLAALLNPDGVLFGATVVSAGARACVPAKLLMRTCNAAGIFSNAHDDVEGLRAALERSFTHVRIDTCGAVALFSGRRRAC